MLLIVNNDDEEASAYAALAVIKRLLRRGDIGPHRLALIEDMFDGGPWINTRLANEEYL